jgi:hypothetical protein
MKITQEKGALILSVLLIFLSVFLYYQTYSFPRELGSTGSSYGSAFFPRFLLIFIVFCANILLFRTIIRKHKKESGKIIQLSWSQIARIFGLWFVCLGFFLAWKYWGYLYTSAIFILAAGLVLGIRNIFSLAALMAAGPLMYMVFARFLKVSF